MARHSTMLALGTQAPAFALPDVNGTMRRLAEFSDAPALLVAFICNHCPYVKHILEAFVRFANEYVAKGLAVVAVSSNDVESYPQDGPAPWRDLPRSKALASHTFSMKAKRLLRHIRPYARRNSFFLTASAGSSTAVNSTPVVREVTLS